MKHLKTFEGLFDIFKKDKYQFYKKIAKDLDVPYKETGERAMLFGPKNGHEISVGIGADGCAVRAYYNDEHGRTLYKDEMVVDIENYLRNYDFNSKPYINRPKHRKISSRNSDDIDNDVYCFMTKELRDRKKNHRHISMAHDAYHLEYNTPKKLKELQEKYPIGGTYKGETIIATSTMNSKNLSQ